MFLGGHLKDIPLPHKRKFDDKRRRRKVSVHITTFPGAGVHYHVSLSEEDNPIWNPSKDTWKWMNGSNRIIGWQVAWDDEGARGRHLNSVHSKSLEEAQRWAVETFNREFDPKTHVMIDHGHGYRKPKWYYRDGD